MHPSSDQLDAFVSAQPHAIFLQSSGWKTFQAALGRTVAVFSWGEPPHPHASALCIETRTPFGFRYWFCPRGPVLADATQGTAIATELAIEARKRGMVFLRIEPPVASLPNHGWQASRSIHPANTLLVDLAQSEQELLQAMKSKTRYNIRVAEKRGVSIEITAESSGVDTFFSLLSETGVRQGIRSHEKSYYQTLLRQLGQGDPSDHRHLACRLLIARLRGQPIAANLLMFYGDTVTYLFGGSSDAHRSVMAPVLLQWHAIKQAKALGYRWYDFWGIAPSSHSASHPWAGITRFKQGFGGSPISFPGTFDVPIAKLSYWAYWILRSLRKGKASFL